ncbi:MAG: hypothetical protein IJ820_09265 [Lachnospiraceae bacterium]|nr:hypothetical protein [Lachnospiraceae bacterium]
MLGKLFKNEMKAMGRILLPLYLVMIFASCLFAFNVRLNMSGTAKFIVDRFAIVTGFLFGAAVLVVGVVMVIMVVQRFYKNLLGSEGYLMFTLPAKTHEHILSKAFSAFLWMVLGGVAGAISGFAMVAITSNVPEFIRQVQDVWKTLSPNNSLAPVIWLIVMLAVSVMESMIKVYAAISVGHQFGSHRLIASVLAYIGFGIVETVITIVGNKLHLLPSRLLNSTNAAGFVSVQAMQMGTLAALIGIAVYGFLCWYLLDRRLNLE